jgi:bilin biosynthesis protein
MSQDALFEQLKHPNPNIRNRAMIEIADTRDADTIPRLVAVLDDEDVTFRRAAVQALGVIGADAVPAVVESLLSSENVTVRGSCAKALAQVAVNYRDEPFPAVGFEGLKQSLNDPNPVVHIASAMALGEMGSPAFGIVSESLATTDNPALAVSLVNALAAIADEQSMVLLQEVSQDEQTDSYVRETAISAISRIELVRNNQPRR